MGSLIDVDLLDICCINLKVSTTHYDDSSEFFYFSEVMLITRR